MKTTIRYRKFAVTKKGEGAMLITSNLILREFRKTIRPGYKIKVFNEN
jgi:hypothetical protein